MPEIKYHPVHDDIKGEQFDVFIAGSGPIGATYARLLVDRGYSVCMVDIGDVHDGHHPGAHLKNEIRFQKDIDAFVRVIQGALSTVSIPTSSMVLPTLDPAAYHVPPKGGKDGDAIITHGRNPKQELFDNLGAEAVTRCVGGMSTHWTCATPELIKGVERPQIFPSSDTNDKEEWEKLYKAAKYLIGTSDTQFNESIRHKIVFDALTNSKDFKGRGVKALPLACRRIGDGPYVRWHSAENIYGKDFFVKTPANGKGIFRLLHSTRCTKLYEKGGEIQLVEVRSLIKAMDKKNEEDSDFAIKARVYVIAAGAVATPQILANSEFGGLRRQETAGTKNVLIPSLGKYITEQPMAFCQIVLRQVDQVDKSEDGKDKDANGNVVVRPPWWTKAVADHQKAFPNDPIKMRVIGSPYQDPEPQVNIPVSKEFPWHAQIHRDAFSYGEAGPLVDARLVVDLRFFGMQHGVPENRIIFEDYRDTYGMPQATFHYLPTPDRAKQASDMMEDMMKAAHVLGGYLPGSNPQFMTPGLALHLGGSIRLGHEGEKSETVADYNSRVWNTKNLYVAGNGTIPTAFAGNPTLTSICFAIRSASAIHDYLKSPGHVNVPGPYLPTASAEKYRTPQEFKVRETVQDPTIKATTDEWLKWVKDDDPHVTLRDLSDSVFA
ncbi:pyranose oxidase [Exidia glandulosa HHB12029]|uniref:Pyranose 2-oxidase n=1 Tax=Exidia glandulosa HHB12029 TaxID=1314781 RepID=A0A166N1S1_EXIGL|nr:pyranose oxidase [Exidia glandulosa HHB12029]